MSICSDDDCDRRAYARGLCGKHYQSAMKAGEIDKHSRLKDRPPPVCSVEGCMRRRRSRGWCVAHYQQWWLTGQEPAGPIRGRGFQYLAAHRRVLVLRGRAKDHACVDCEQTAAHWSYDHAADDELLDPRGYPYSGDPSHYAPRCVPCHKRFDTGRLRVVVGFGLQD